MGFLDYFKRSKPSKEAASPLGSSAARGDSGSGSLAHWLNYGDACWAAEFDKNARLSTPIHNLAVDVAKVAWSIKSKSGKNPSQDQTVTSGDLYELFQMPHPRMVPFIFMYTITTFLLLVGTCPVEIDESGEYPILRPIPPHWITERPTKASSKWKFKWFDGTEREAEAENMMELYLPSMVNPYMGGNGLAKGINSEVSQNKAMANFNDYYFQNMAVLGTIVNVPGGDLDRMKEEWQKEKEGVRNSFKTLFTNGDSMSVSNMGPKLSELNFPEGQKLNRDLINQRFNQPPERQGILENSNRSTVEAADFGQQNNNVYPICIYLQQSFNAYLVPMFDMTGKLYLDFENPVKEVASDKLARMKELGTNGFLTINEVRESYGFPSVKGGDVFQIPVNNVCLVPSDKLAQVAEILIAQLSAIAQSSGPLQTPQNPPPSNETARTAELCVLLAQILRSSQNLPPPQEKGQCNENY